MLFIFLFVLLFIQERLLRGNPLKAKVLQSTNGGDCHLKI